MKTLLRNLFRFYIDWPLIVVFVLLVFLFRAAIVDDLLLPLAVQLSSAASNSVASTLWLAILANVITTILLATVGLFSFRLLKRARLSGDYKAFQIEGTTETPYGSATILYALLAFDRNGVPVKLRLKHNDVELEGRGLLVNNQFLVGYYTETGKPERRRCGSFHYQLDGDGQTWRGKFVYVSPDTAAIVAGEAKWSRG